jgi:hypothetical protein
LREFAGKLKNRHFKSTYGGQGVLFIALITHSVVPSKLSFLRKQESTVATAKFIREPLRSKKAVIPAEADAGFKILAGLRAKSSRKEVKQPV